jgi:hypothetical protein
MEVKMDRRYSRAIAVFLMAGLAGSLGNQGASAWADEVNSASSKKNKEPTVRESIIGKWKISSIHSKGTIVLGEEQKVDTILNNLEGENRIILNDDQSFEMAINDERTNKETGPSATKGEATWKLKGKEVVVKFTNKDKDKAFKLTFQVKNDHSIEGRCVEKEELTMLGIKMKVDIVETYECAR